MNELTTSHSIPQALRKAQLGPVLLTTRDEPAGVIMTFETAQRLGMFRRRDEEDALPTLGRAFGVDRQGLQTLPDRQVAEDEP